MFNVIQVKFKLIFKKSFIEIEFLSFEKINYNFIKS